MACKPGIAASLSLRPSTFYHNLILSFLRYANIATDSVAIPGF